MLEVRKQTIFEEGGKNIDWGNGMLLMFYFLTWMVITQMGHLVIIFQAYDLYVFLYG